MKIDDKVRYIKNPFKYGFEGEDPIIEEGIVVAMSVTPDKFMPKCAVKNSNGEIDLLTLVTEMLREKTQTTETWMRDLSQVDSFTNELIEEYWK